jgi:hypothetical protein
MAKFIITEKQYNTIKKNVNEEINNNRYEKRVRTDIETYGVKINGEDIDWAVSGELNLDYLIEMEHRSWGIKDVSLYDIQGPSEIEIEITPQVDDAEDVILTLSYDWNNVEREVETGRGVITIGSEITIKLGNNENGDVIIESIHIPVYTI